MEPFLLFALTAFFLVVPAFYNRIADVVCCVLVSTLLVVCAGLRPYGIDYAEYLAIIELISRADLDDFDSLVSIAKDPLFFLIVFPITAITNDRDYVFLTIALISVIPKTLVALQFSRFSALMMACYAVLLAPGLEFAAIRAGLAIGFCGLLAVRGLGKRLKVGGATLGIFSHLSAAAAAGAFAISRHRRIEKTVAIVVLTIAGTYVALVSYDWLFALDALIGTSRAENYEGDFGTGNNLIFPAVTMIILGIAVRWSAMERVMDKSAEALNPLYAAFFLCASALGASLPLSTYVIRILEYSWFFYLVGMLQIFSFTKVEFVRSGFLLWGTFLALINIYRGLWEAMRPALFS